MDLRLDDPDPRIRDLAYLLFLDELLGGKWVERWAPRWRESGMSIAFGAGAVVQRPPMKFGMRSWTVVTHLLGRLNSSNGA